MTMSPSPPPELEKVSINGLAPELLVHILTCLDVQSILRCATVCKRFYHIISSSPEIQYYLALYLNHLQVVPYCLHSSSHLSSGSIVTSSPFSPHEVLAKHQHAWRTMTWTRQFSIPRSLEGADITGLTLSDGVLVLLNRRTRRVVRIPNGLRSSRKRVAIQQPNTTISSSLPSPGPEEPTLSHRKSNRHKRAREEAKLLKRLTSTFAFRYDVSRFFADAGQDLFVTSEVSAVQPNESVIRARFHTLSSGAPHPLAYAPTVSVEKSVSQNTTGGIQVFGSLVALLRYSSTAHRNSLYVWNWKDSKPSVRSKVIDGPISDFLFLSPTAVLLAVADRHRGTVPRLVIVDLYSITPENPRIDVFRDPARTYALPSSLQYASVHIAFHSSHTDSPFPLPGQNDPLVQDESGLVDEYFFKTDSEDKLIAVQLAVNADLGAQNTVIIIPRSDLWPYPANPSNLDPENIWRPPMSVRLSQDLGASSRPPPTYTESSLNRSSQRTFYDWKDWAPNTAVFVPQNRSMRFSLHGMKLFLVHDRGAVCCLYDFWKPRVRRAKWVEDVMENERRKWVFTSFNDAQDASPSRDEDDGEEDRKGGMRGMLDYLTGLKKNLGPNDPRDAVRKEPQESASRSLSESQPKSPTPPPPRMDTPPPPVSSQGGPLLHDTEIQSGEETFALAPETPDEIDPDFPNFFIDEQGDVVMLDPAEINPLVQLELQSHFTSNSSQATTPPASSSSIAGPSSSQAQSRIEVPLRQDSGSSILSSHTSGTEGTTSADQEEEDEDYAEEFGFFPPPFEDTGTHADRDGDDDGDGDGAAALEWANRTFGVRRLPCVNTMFCSPEFVGAEEVWLDEDGIQVLKEDEVLALVF